MSRRRSSRTDEGPEQSAAASAPMPYVKGQLEALVYTMKPGPFDEWAAMVDKVNAYWLKGR